MSGRISILLSILTLLLLPACAANFEGHPVFEPVDCWFEIPGEANVTCGYVKVPEDQSKPITPENTIRLAVAVFHSSSESPAPDPVVYQIGGPGGHMLGLVSYIYEKVIAPFLKTRDLILFDSRGTGFSQPALECKDGEELAECGQHLSAEGRNLYAYNSISMVKDLLDLRAALGYDQWNIG